MSAPIRDWLKRKWSRTPDAGLVDAYGATFSSPHGQKVLKHLLDSVYCQVYEGHDPLEMAAHCGARRVVHEILQNVDYTESPMKYELTKENQYG